MFSVNPSAMFELRGIKKPLASMVKWGFTYNIAWRIFNNKAIRIDLAHLEILCLNLNCTPNDIIQWQPAKDAPQNPAHPLQALRPKTDTQTITQMLSDFPVDKVEELEKAILLLKNKTTSEQ